VIIEIPGTPEPQARMKYTSRGGFARAYDPKEKQKELIRHILRCKTALHDYQFPRISFFFYMPIPASTPKKVREMMRSERVKHVKRPDVDNLCKLYLDCMDGIVFERDEKVALGSCIKVYSEEPRTTIIINDTPRVLSDLEFRQAFALESCESALSGLQCLSLCEIPHLQLPSQFLHMSSSDCKDQSSC
jgi:Holliday junction resolvase RusA-like endonuclease